MELLTPDFGTFFWMLVSFIIVFVILAKFGFPALVNMVNERKQYIDDSLKSAREANEKLSHIKEESESILVEARKEQARILKEAMDTRTQIVNEARDKAKAEGGRLLEEARKQIQKEKDDAIRDIRKQVAELSVEVAQKVLRKQLSSEVEQNGMIERMLDEVSDSKK
ncbi:MULTISPECIES: F0F1 ATP synthase subunit B [Bacteroidaceae]|jgi:F-type H+-transporting ATPase subunit b|uniref:F0F1 ATP synthase subunit B n=1 Tax=Bacteroidaceae TaxID=815 RepID=UPI00033C8154|nr:MULTISPECIES: F0F1 ATP synthase subunit B [Bacteroidaceae]MCL1607773.1 F0F1 ATP synthase subunit B [Mediterranea sp. ET5]MDM8123885.1 F0F1 ATP synthase subunit B [Mediterranea massiliensis]MDM8197252.1 F0F1 ATP synthase subunit B [Mediterranea massiliensis]CDD82660.1 aTP synthase subunit B [Bacteroides sp. CAG:462]